MLKSSYIEILLGICVILVYVFYLGYPKESIHDDGLGHSDYLRSIFIHQDLVRFDKPETENPKPYYRITHQLSGYEPIDGFRVNKYPFGVSLLQLPFFISAWASTGFDQNVTGLETPFQAASFCSAIIYLILALVFIRNFFELFGITKSIITVVQMLMVFATPVIYFAGQESSYGHIYSLFAISMFCFFAGRILIRNSVDSIFPSLAAFALVFSIRYFNILIILALPLLAIKSENLSKALACIKQNPKPFLKGIGIIMLAILIQSILYYLQTSRFWLDPYSDENFNLAQPAFASLLFSFNKGLFTYTPVLVFSLVGVVYQLWKRKVYFAFNWLFFFGLISYLISSWWWWSNGASHGQRFFIDFFPILFLPMALLFTQVRMSQLVVFIAIGSLTIPLNIIQAYQYKYHIMPWENLNWEGYKKIFLRQDPILSGYASRQKIDEEHFEELDRKNILDITIPPNTNSSIFTINSESINMFDEIAAIEVKLTADFDLDFHHRVFFCIGDTAHTTCDVYDEFPFVHFSPGIFDREVSGSTAFIFKPFNDSIPRLIKLSIQTKNFQLDLKGIEVVFYRKVIVKS